MKVEHQVYEAAVCMYGLDTVFCRKDNSPQARLGEHKAGQTRFHDTFQFFINFSFRTFNIQSNTCLREIFIASYAISRHESFRSGALFKRAAFSLPTSTCIFEGELHQELGPPTADLCYFALPNPNFLF